jgi:hypothetical protein
MDPIAQNREKTSYSMTILQQKFPIDFVVGLLEINNWY